MIKYRSFKGRRDFGSFKESTRNKIARERQVKPSDISDQDVLQRIVGSSSKGNAAIDSKYLEGR